MTDSNHRHHTSADRHGQRRVAGHLSANTLRPRQHATLAYITIQEAAAMLNVSERTITRWIKKDAVVTFKNGHRRLVCRDSLARLTDKYDDKRTDTNAPDDATFTNTLLDIHELISLLVALYHPEQLSDLTRKRDIQTRVTELCTAKKHTGGTHD
ncbi:MAG: helix-turn-helix domain-containing protein [Idiomarina sp.]|nr:helix-turn-helix domain-containing protein [Idiomarina sp.]